MLNRFEFFACYNFLNIFSFPEELFLFFLLSTDFFFIFSVPRIVYVDLWTPFVFKFISYTSINFVFVIIYFNLSLIQLIENWFFKVLVKQLYYKHCAAIKLSFARILHQEKKFTFRSIIFVNNIEHELPKVKKLCWMIHASQNFFGCKKKSKN